MPRKRRLALLGSAGLPVKRFAFRISLMTACSHREMTSAGVGHQRLQRHQRSQTNRIDRCDGIIVQVQGDEREADSVKIGIFRELVVLKVEVRCVSRAGKVSCAVYGGDTIVDYLKTCFWLCLVSENLLPWKRGVVAVAQVVGLCSTRLTLHLHRR